MNPPIDTGDFFTSAARTATTNSTQKINRVHRGLVVDIDITAADATPSVVFNIQAKDKLSGVWTTILASAAQTAAAHVRLVVYPGAVAVANQVLNQPLPKYFRLNATAADADALTYSANYQLVP